MPSDALVSYTWASFADANKTRYRDTATGRFVSRATVQEFVDSRIATAERRFDDLTRAYFDGRVSASTWQITMRDEMRRYATQNAVLGIGGYDRMSAREWGRIGGLLRDDYARMTNLAQGIQDGTVTLPQAMERIRGYMGNARLNYHEAERTALMNREQQTDTQLLMIRDLGNANHCEDCLSYHSAGWSYDLPLPSQSCACSSHCRCSVRYRDVMYVDVDAWLGTRR